MPSFRNFAPKFLAASPDLIPISSTECHQLNFLCISPLCIYVLVIGPKQKASVNIKIIYGFFLSLRNPSPAFSVFSYLEAVVSYILPIVYSRKLSSVFCYFIMVGRSFGPLFLKYNLRSTIDNYVHLYIFWSLFLIFKRILTVEYLENIETKK